MADGSVTIDTFLDNKGFQKGLNSLGSMAKTGLKAITVATGAVAAGFTGMVTASVNARGEIEQQIGGTEAVFGKYAKEVQEMAKKSYDTMGTSANDYMATMNKMTSLMKGSNIDTKKAMDLSSQAMQRAADVASIMGIDINSAMESIAGAAKGNFTMMDNLGVAMNATTIEAYALSKGIKKSYKDMSNAEKIQLAMEMFLEKSTYATGNYAKENDTLSGSLTTLKASWNNFLSGAGDLGQVTGALTKAITNIIKTVEEALPEIMKNITDWLPEIIKTGSSLIKQIIQGIVKYLPELMSQAGGIVKSLIQGIIDLLPELIPIAEQVLQTLIEGLVSFLPQLIESAGAIIDVLVQGILSALPLLIPATLQIIQTLLTGLIEYLPQIIQVGMQVISELIMGIAQMLPTLIPQAVDCVITIVEGLLDNIDMLIDAGIELILGLADGLIEALPRLIEKAPIIIEKLVSAILRNLPKLLSTGVQLIGKLASGLIQAIPQLISKIPQIVSAIVKSFSGLGSKFLEIGSNMVKGIWNGISNVKNWIFDKIKGFKDAVLNKFKSFFGIHSPSTLFRDEIGEYLALGIGEGFNNNIDSVYKKMKSAVDFETQKLSTNLSTTANVNKVFVANINLNGDVNMDSERVGRMVAPAVSRTFRTAGVY